MSCISPCIPLFDPRAPTTCHLACHLACHSPFAIRHSPFGPPCLTPYHPLLLYHLPPRTYLDPPIALNLALPTQLIPRHSGPPAQGPQVSPNTPSPNSHFPGVSVSYYVIMSYHMHDDIHVMSCHVIHTISYHLGPLPPASPTCLPLASHLPPTCLPLASPKSLQNISSPNFHFPGVVTSHHPTPLMCCPAVLGSCTRPSALLAPASTTRHSALGTRHLVPRNAPKTPSHTMIALLPGRPPVSCLPSTRASGSYPGSHRFGLLPLAALEPLII